MNGRSRLDRYQNLRTSNNSEDFDSTQQLNRNYSSTNSYSQSRYQTSEYDRLLKEHEDFLKSLDEQFGVVENDDLDNTVIYNKPLFENNAETLTETVQNTPVLENPLFEENKVETQPVEENNGFAFTQPETFVNNAYEEPAVTEPVQEEPVFVQPEVEPTPVEETTNVEEIKNEVKEEPLFKSVISNYAYQTDYSYSQDTNAPQSFSYDFASTYNFNSFAVPTAQQTVEIPSFQPTIQPVVEETPSVESFVQEETATFKPFETVTEDIKAEEEIPTTEETFTYEQPAQEAFFDRLVVEETPVIEETYEQSMEENTPVQEEIFEQPVFEDIPVQEELFNQPVVEQTLVEEETFQQPIFEDIPVQEETYEQPLVEETPVEEETYEQPIEENIPVQEELFSEPVVEETPVQEFYQQPVVEETPSVESFAQEEVYEQPTVEETPVQEETPIQEQTSESISPTNELVDEDIADLDSFVSEQPADDLILDKTMTYTNMNSFIDDILSDIQVSTAPKAVEEIAKEEAIQPANALEQETTQTNNFMPENDDQNLVDDITEQIKLMDLNNFNFSDEKIEETPVEEETIDLSLETEEKVEQPIEDEYTIELPKDIYIPQPEFEAENNIQQPIFYDDPTNINELTTNLELEKAKNEELLDKTIQLDYKAAQLENELDTANDAIVKTNKILNLVLTILILALFGILFVLAFWFAKSRGLF